MYPTHADLLHADLPLSPGVPDPRPGRDAPTPPLPVPPDDPAAPDIERGPNIDPPPTDPAIRDPQPDQAPRLRAMSARTLPPGDAPLRH